MTPEEFQKNIVAARALCNENVDKKMNKTAKSARSQINSALDQGVDNSVVVKATAQDDAWDRMFLSDAAYDSTPAPATTVNPMTKTSISKSRVPDFIKQSMVNERIDTSALSSNPLDRMDLSAVQQPINEQRPPVTIPTPQANTTGIDYSILRAIILECIDSKFKELGITKELLSENTLKTIHLSGGNINLVDNKGNVFGAKLEMKGNVNKK